MGSSFLLFSALATHVAGFAMQLRPDQVCRCVHVRNWPISACITINTSKNMECFKNIERF